MFMLLKLLYSGLICIALTILLRELYLVWLDDRVYVGKFNVIAEGVENSEAGTEYAHRVVGAQAILNRQLLDYQRRAGAASPTDSTYTLPGSSSLALPPEALKGIDITIQSVNLREIFSALRKSFSAPNEVQGHVTATSGSVLAAIDWPRAPAPANGGERLTQFLTPSQSDMQSSASYVACSLAWARAASLSREFADKPRNQFCDFSKSLGDLYSFIAKASTPDGLSEAETAIVRKQAVVLRSYYGSTTFLPEIYRLRADLLDLIPEKLRIASELVEAQEDRLSYAMLSPNLEKLPETEKRFVAAALARPAIILSKGKLSDIPSNWSALLSKHETDISRISSSTGILLSKSNEPIGSAFVVAPSLALAARHAILRFSTSTNGALKLNEGLSLCFSDDFKNCGDEQSMLLGSIIYDGGDATNVVLIDLHDHDLIPIQPAPIAETIPAANALIGTYAYVVGYPFLDKRLPPEFVARLIGPKGGLKRVMPGRILGFGTGTPFGRLAITSDISTTGGTSGGPLVDLTTGKVIGVSFAGQWKGQRGKFAYAEPISGDAMAIIESRSRGEKAPLLSNQ
jgi:hypothetical protein